MENHDYYIYCYTNKYNNKKYIGQTKHSKEIRSGINGWKYERCPKFWAAIQKYGCDIGRVCSGKRKTAGSYHWEFV